MVSYTKEMTAEDMMGPSSESRLIRTEISTLVGLLIKKDLDLTMPPAAVIQEYIDKTEALLEELHHTMSATMFSNLDAKKDLAEGFTPFEAGEVLREPIFYGGESAYSFQYRDLSPKKYAKDDVWLMANKGFSIQAAKDVVRAVQMVQTQNLTARLRGMRNLPPEQWTFLPAFTFTGREIATQSGIDETTVQNVLTAFTVPDKHNNSNFCSFTDFNTYNALPILRTGDDSFLLFQQYSLVEALFESPFYWMCDDTNYFNADMQNRGHFTEAFSYERLALVFGRENVFLNVDILESETNKLGQCYT